MAKVAIILSLMLFEAVHASTFGCDGTDEACSRGDDTSLLQKKRDMKLEKQSGSKSSGNRAITFQGGGFSSVATHLAVLVAVMIAIGKNRNLPQSELTVEGTNLFANFDLFSSVSGGSWFISSALYSATFNNLMASLAQNPGTAGTSFNDDYMNAWVAKAKETGGYLGDLGTAFADFDVPALSESLFWGNFIKDQGSWANFIQQYLAITTHGDIAKSTPLGSQPQPWANGKKWFACCSLVTPTPSGKYDFAARYRAGFLNDYKLYYEVVNSGPLPTYLPARYQIAFPGSEESSTFLTTADVGSAAVHWVNEQDYLTSAQKTGPNLQDFGNLATGVKELPLYHVVATSSAAGGGQILTHALGDVAADLNELGPRLAIWAAPHAKDPLHAVEQLLEPFETTDAKLGTPTLDNITEMGAFSLVDGVYTDNSAIAHTIAAGATDITAFVAWKSLKLLFGSTDFTYYTTATVPFQGYPIFANSSQSALDAINSFGNSISGKFFELSFGELNLVTRENSLFGIQAGTSVRLRLILGGTGGKLGVGAFDNFADFGSALSSIIDDITNLASQGEAAMDTLRGFFE